MGRHVYCARCVATHPICFSCGLPSLTHRTLPDGRVICGYCRRRAVTTDREAAPHYERARRFLETWTAIELKTVPKLKLVDMFEMSALAKAIRKTTDSVALRGLYSRQTTTLLTPRGKTLPVSETETIYVADHLYDEIFRVAAVHELMHDLIHERFSRLEKAPLWVQEGICQQASAELCRRRRYDDALAVIESSRDPDYGDGYRYVRNLSGSEHWKNWNALRKWMETIDVGLLPETAPHVGPA